ncbi:MAG TPA: helix-hairpin-helix domain-containing protein [Nitrospira sp.]|jgi:competence protein ComEA|nr:helix-hairpin-helix domain-containing protein [Nitrospira sp.]
MMHSLLIKVAMLAVTLGALLWIASVTPVTKVMPPQAHLPALAPITTASSAHVPTPSVVSTPKDPSANQPAVWPVRPTVRPVGEIERSFQQATPPADSRPTSQATLRPVDLNQATVADLEALPGIGPKLAQRVIEHRDERGPFHSVEELRQVKGIGRKKFDRLRPHVLVTNTRSLARHKGTL